MDGRRQLALEIHGHSLQGWSTSDVHSDMQFIESTHGVMYAPFVVKRKFPVPPLAKIGATESSSPFWHTARFSLLLEINARARALTAPLAACARSTATGSRVFVVSRSCLSFLAVPL